MGAGSPIATALKREAGVNPAQGRCCVRSESRVWTPLRVIAGRLPGFVGTVSQKTCLCELVTAPRTRVAG